jgi:peptidyl-dipeptidase A
MGDKLSLQEFIDHHVAVSSEKYRNLCLTYFDAITSGETEKFALAADAQLARDTLYANKQDFQQIQNFRLSTISDPILRRQLDVLFLSYQANQVDEKRLKEMVDIQNKIEQKFSLFRAKINDKEYTDNEIEQLLSTSHDSEEVKKAWLASKAVG